MREITEEEYVEYIELRKMKKLELYAYTFWEQLAKEIFCWTINAKSLPIFFKPIDDIFQDNSNGHISNQKMDSGIEIVTLTVNLHKACGLDILQRTIRHELLHFGLFISDLKNTDFDAVFKILCELYDANFYKRDIGELNNQIYTIAYPYLQEVFQCLKEEHIEVAHVVLSNMVKIIGNKKICQTSDLISMKQDIIAESEALKCWIEYNDC